jgi:hypothetical protein
MGTLPRLPQALYHHLIRQNHFVQAAVGQEPAGTKLFGQVGLLAILLVFVSLATLHSLIVPLTQGEDELAHYRYLSFIAQTGRLPINEAERKQAWYRADWPPLYHLLVGWVVSPLDTLRPHLKDVGESPRRRLVGEIFYPRLIIYTEDANWPWQDGILAWHIGRFISILFAAVALVFTYLTTFELAQKIVEQGSQGKPGFLLPTSPHGLALATTTLLAFTPRYLFTSAMLGDDSLFILLSAVFIWLLLRVVRGSDHWGLYALMGSLLGLSIATKYSTGLLPVVLIPVVWWRAKQAGWPWSKSVGRIALTWLFTLLGSSWWFGWIGYYFNSVQQDGLFFGLLKPLLASGPDVSMRRIFAFFGGGVFTGQERPAAIAAGSFWDWWVYLFQTFWGVLVLEKDPLLPWAYLLVALVCLLAMIGLVRLWRITQVNIRITIIVLALIVGLLLPFPILRFFLTLNILETGQGRHILYPAAQAIPILLMLGWVSLTRPKASDQKAELGKFKPSANGWPAVYQTATPRLSAIFWLWLPVALLLGWSLFQLVYMRVSYPAPLPVQTTTFNSTSIPQPLKHNFGEAIQLLGYDFRPDAGQAIINLTLFWRALKPVEENFRTQVQLVDAAGRPHLTWLSHPLNGRYPTRAWDQGDVVRDTLPLPLAAVPADTYSLQLNLLHEADDKAINEQPFEFIYVPLGQQPPIPQAKTLNKFEYRLWVDERPARYRQTIPLSWRFLDEPATDANSNFQSPTPKPTWALIGPDEAPRLPVASGDATLIFMVGADWPSGPYRLLVSTSADSYQTAPLLTVANEARNFTLPANVVGYTSVEANFGDQVKLLGYVAPTRRLEPGSGLPLTLYWQSLAPVLGDYVVFDKLLDETQQVYGGYDRLPREYYSTILWAEGEVVEDGLAVPVAVDAPPGIYQLHVGLYALASGSPVSLPLVKDSQPTGASSVVIGPFKVGGPPKGVTIASAQPQIALNQNLGDHITLLGYDVDRATLENCSTTSENCRLNLTLYWQAKASPVADYTTFLHLRNRANETITQKDSPPAGGRYPTSLWDAGEIVLDRLELPLAEVPPGIYTPVVGLYNFADGQRLSTPSGTGEIFLEPIELP